MTPAEIRANLTRPEYELLYLPAAGWQIEPTAGALGALWDLELVKISKNKGRWVVAEVLPLGFRVAGVTP